MKKILFVLALTSIVVSCSHKKEEERQETKPSKNNYLLATVEKGGLTTSVKLPAQLIGYQEVSIFPKVNGYVKNVLVDIGSHVTKGQLLMTLEAPELVQASLQAKEKYAKTKSDYTIVKESYQRLLQAAQTPGAVSPLDLSSLRAKVEADSSLSNAEKANWQMQQQMLDYLNITAPFTGIITERNIHPGALVSAASKEKPMLELKEYDLLRLVVDVPENIAVNLRLKDTVSFFISALNGLKKIGYVSRKSDNINAQFRSERVEADVKNDGTLSSGMYADVILYSKGSVETLRVPKSAVVISTEKKYVIVVRNHQTVKIEVSTHNETADKIEISGALQAGEQIIAKANDEIKEGIIVE